MTQGDQILPTNKTWCFMTKGDQTLEVLFVSTSYQTGLDTRFQGDQILEVLFVSVAHQTGIDRRSWLKVIKSWKCYLSASNTRSWLKVNKSWKCYLSLPQTRQNLTQGDEKSSRGEQIPEGHEVNKYRKCYLSLPLSLSPDRTWHKFMTQCHDIREQWFVSNPPH